MQVSVVSGVLAALPSFAVVYPERNHAPACCFFAVPVMLIKIHSVCQWLRGIFLIRD